MKKLRYWLRPSPLSMELAILGKTYSTIRSNKEGMMAVIFASIITVALSVTLYFTGLGGIIVNVAYISFVYFVVHDEGRDKVKEIRYCNFKDTTAILLTQYCFILKDIAFFHYYSVYGGMLQSVTTMVFFVFVIEYYVAKKAVREEKLNILKGIY